MLKKIRKKLLAALTEKVQAQQPLTLLEKEFLKENGVDIEKITKKKYNSNIIVNYTGYNI